MERYAVTGKAKLLPSGAPSKLTDLELESIAEKCRAKFQGNEQTTMITLKKYVADVTWVVEVSDSTECIQKNA